MSIILTKGESISDELHDALSMECPYCNVHAHMKPQSLPDTGQLLRDRPDHVGLVFQCTACNAPVFLRFTVREYQEDSVRLRRAFVELERPKERFSFSYLPKQTEILFREALACYSINSFNAFASMCHRAATSAFESLGDGGKLQAFEEVIVAQGIAGIDDDTFAPIKDILFGADSEDALPLLDRAEAGILLEILKDLFYQLFVRRGKLTRAIKVRRFFVNEERQDRQSA